GMAVARQLGGVPVMPSDGDFKRKRLLNIVEEMAIAARIRKPGIYILTEEPGINAFAAGNSPDEASVVVTQGALDHLDREQLQAVIGHEFSHVLIAGSVGLLAGRLLQAAVSRRREHLADASSVQFTRTPQALQGAFVTMAAHPQGSRLQHTGAFEFAHMLFA